MAKVIAIANQKGGVGKTTTAVSLGYDEPDQLEETLVGVLSKVVNEEEIPDKYAVINVRENVDLVPSNIALSEKKLNKYFPSHMSSREREKIILNLLAKWKEEQEG